MIEFQGNQIPRGYFPSWNRALQYAVAMYTYHGMKFTVRSTGRGEWVVFVPKRRRVESD
jgi:hypothetical protein